MSCPHSSLSSPASGHHSFSVFFLQPSVIGQTQRKTSRISSPIQPRTWSWCCTVVAIVGDASPGTPTVVHSIRREEIGHHVLVVEEDVMQRLCHRVAVGASRAAAVWMMSTRRRVAVENGDDASVADFDGDDTVSFSPSSLLSLNGERADNVLKVKSKE